MQTSWLRRTNDSPPRLVCILTAKADVELPATLLAFGVDPESEPSKHTQDNRCWLSSVTSRSGEVLNVVIACMAGSGNIHSARATRDLLSHYYPECAFFTGIACGLQAYALGDVVASNMVLSYEYVKTAEAGPINRNRMFVPPSHVVSDVNYFTATTLWHRQFRDIASRVPPSCLPARAIAEPTFRGLVSIASGEKVLGNSELKEFKETYDLVGAGEMEAAGFAAACEAERPHIPWLVLRGISDYGDRSKDGADPSGPKKDEYHFVAALTSATFLRAFLETCYTPAPQQPSATAFREPRAAPATLGESVAGTSPTLRPTIRVWPQSQRVLLAWLPLGLLGCLLVLSASLAIGMPSAANVAIVALAATVHCLAWKHLVSRVEGLRKLGIADWDALMSEGTTTYDCIQNSQTHLSFLGIAASKWLAHPAEFRSMLERHASAGGATEFVLLKPHSESCRRFERIKKMREGSLSGLIEQNVQALLALRRQHLPISVYLYDHEPHFRLVVLDEAKLIVGLYSYRSESGDSPQLILSKSPQLWSLYFSFRAYFNSLHATSTPCEPAS